MKMVFNIKDLSINSLPKLLSEISNSDFKVRVDLKLRTITAIIRDPDHIQVAIDLVSNLFTVLKIDIENEVKVVTEPENKTETETATETETQAEIEAETQTQLEEKPELLSGYTSINNSNLCVSCFSNVDVNDNFSRLCQTVSELLKQKTTRPLNVCKYIRSLKAELRFQFDKTLSKSVNYAPGDIVDICVGTRVTGEVSGTHVLAVVISVADDSMPFVIPCYYALQEGFYRHYLELEEEKDFTFTEPTENHTVRLYAILDRAQSYNSIRINSVVARCTDKTLRKLVSVLPSAFTFGECENSDSIENSDACNGPKVISEPDQKVLSTTIATNTSIFQNITDFILQYEKFTYKQIRENFPNVKTGTISWTLNVLKKNGKISPTDKRGEYIVT